VAAISKGLIEPGDYLPPSRALATKLTRKAFRLLSRVRLICND
jgi:DNA-binding transcriptional regulator YhcF (GntR family)